MQKPFKGIAALLLSCALGLAAAPAATAASAKDALDPNLVASYAEKAGVSPDRAETNLGLQAQAGDVVGNLRRALGDRYAGVRFDGRSSTFFVPALSDDDAKKASGVLTGSGIDAARVETKVVEHAWDELVAASSAAGRDDGIRPLLKRQDAVVGVDERRNAVVVTVSPSVEQAAAEAATRRLAAAAGVDVVVETSDRELPTVSPDACLWVRYSSRCDKPLRGGVTIAGTNVSCSMGALAHRNGLYYVMTAGHCLRDRGAWWAIERATGAWRGIGQAGGFSYGYAHPTPFTTDSGAIDVTSRNWWWQSPWLATNFVDNFWDDYWNTGVGASYPGLGMCHIGQATPNNVGAGNCGVVLNAAITVMYSDGNTLTPMIQTNYCSASGDSGGPILASNVLFGIHSGGGGSQGSGDCRGYYDDAAHVQWIHGVSFVINY